MGSSGHHNGLCESALFHSMAPEVVGAVDAYLEGGQTGSSPLPWSRADRSGVGRKALPWLGDSRRGEARGLRTHRVDRPSSSMVGERLMAARWGQGLARIIHEGHVNNPGLPSPWPFPPAAGRCSVVGRLGIRSASRGRGAV